MHYGHLTVNHSETFKDKDTGACTNMIEGSWRISKKEIPKRIFHDGETLQEYLFQEMWADRNATQLWESLLQVLASVEYEVAFEKRQSKQEEDVDSKESSQKACI